MLREKLLSLESDLSVVPSPYAMTIPEFKELVRKYKEEATMYLAYIYFVSDPRSRYAGYDIEQRRSVVSEILFKKKIKECPIIRAAIQEYSKNLSTSAQLLEAAVESVSTLKKWLQEVDPSNEGYDPLKHVRILESMGKTVNGLKTLEKAVEEESEISDTYGGVEVSRYNE